MLEINKIYNMDNVVGMKMMQAESVDLVVTSPPYDNLRNYNGFSFDLKGVIYELWRIMKAGGVIVWIVAAATINGSETGTSFRQALAFMDVGFNLFDTMIYNKGCNGAVGNNTTYWQAFEYMFIFSKGKPKTINLICDRENNEIRENGCKGTKRTRYGKLRHTFLGGYAQFGRRTNIWQYFTGKWHSTKDDIAFQHPAIFPEQLANDHIYSWSNKGDLVLDPFMGSGTTAKVARALGRNYIGFEISEEYCDLANKRLEMTKTLFD